MAEVNHRSKNLLEQSGALQTASGSEPGEFARRFSERLEGLAASHDLLVASLWQGIGIEDLVRSRLSHVSALVGDRIVLVGPPVRLCAAGSQAIGMALHELATNASKYGALSTAEGRVEMRWSLREESGEPTVGPSWRESLEPAVVRPERRGFGSTVMVRMVELALLARVRLDLLPEGVSWRLQAPAATVLGTRPAESAARVMGIA
jgi:two-component sensor histidine kinase